MFGSKYTPLAAISVSASWSASTPCSTWSQPALTVALIDSGLCACTIVRMPLALRLAARRLQLLVGHRLLAAVADARRREDLDDVGAVRLELPHLLADLLRVPLRSLSERIEVRMRGPGSTPRAIASRSSTSFAAPALWMVVKPASSVT